MKRPVIVLVLLILFFEYSCRQLRGEFDGFKFVPLTYDWDDWANPVPGNLRGFQSANAEWTFSPKDQLWDRESSLWI